MYMTGSKLPLFPDMHIQMPVRVGYINIIKGMRSALRPYAEEATSKVEQIGYLCAPGLAILPLSSILEAANAGAMNPESLAIRWTRGLLPRAIREIAYGIGINELSDTMAEKVDGASRGFEMPVALKTALGSVCAGVAAGFISHIPHQFSTLKLLNPSQSYASIAASLLQAGEKRAAATLAGVVPPAALSRASALAAPVFAFVVPKGLGIRTTQIVGSFVIINSLEAAFTSARQALREGDGSAPAAPGSRVGAAILPGRAALPILKGPWASP